MIDKLDLLKMFNERRTDAEWNKAVEKTVNQLVDAINTIQTEREAERFEIQEWIGIIEAVRKSVNKHGKLIDTLVEENNIHEEQIDELQMKVEPEKCETRAENVQDKFAEQDEIWKDIKGYENQYQISNLGNI